MADTRGLNRTRLSWLLVGLAPLLPACDPASPPPAPVAPAAATQPAAPAPASQPSLPPALSEGYAEWDLETARTKLGDEDAVVARSAAIRIAQESGHLPEEIDDDYAVLLHLASLDDYGWVLGVRLEPHENVEAGITIQPLQMPVWFAADGSVQELPEIADELAIFYPARNPSVFPHLLVTPYDVFVLGEEGLQEALIASDLRGGWFTWHFNRGYPYVYIQHPDAEEGEVARYRWDPYESTFMGPQMERAPDGGTVSMLIDRCELLIPVGGIIPTVEAAEEPEFPEDFEPELPPF